jgi:ABC-type multidrug transport system ATPase subunit
LTEKFILGFLFAGSGKTTLLNTIAGKINIASGEITLNGMRYNKQLRRRMGYVHQEDALMTRLTT